ncbi:MAG: chemotaxis response regulator protein-glutamate methylesterase [Clostridium sp.]|nr:chemotaxis response regulator protein-glutamate methylesterase [Clostridium sp.]
MDQKIRIMVVDDSILFRNWLVQSLGSDPRFEIVGYAVNAYDAKNKVPLLKPDLLTLDIEMPGMSGLEFLKEFLPTHPIPVILVSSLNMRVFDALAAGAVDFVRKPDLENKVGKTTFLNMLKAKVVIGAKARVQIPVTHNTSAPRAGSLRPASAACTAPSEIPSRSRLNISTADPGRIIAIGASTGGTEAILQVLRDLPPTLPGIVITQHMPAGFTSMYAERLNRLCRMEVREAKHGDKVQPGLALLAPGGLQMRVVRIGNGYGVSCSQDEKVNGHCPSVDVLFDSVSIHAREKALGVILTGMGADGAAGLLRMRKNGAYTIGQDRDSCVVYGMPMEAWKIGAVCTQAPLNSIAQNIISHI